MCDFYHDCDDNSDEFGCPDIFTFENCEAETGDRNCNWHEDPVDAWDWAIVISEEQIKVDKFKIVISRERLEPRGSAGPLSV